jgi:histidinol-phosphate aminotransferase
VISIPAKLVEAYHEYAVGADYADSVALLSAQRRPWLVLRTFSKAYGLAALRDADHLHTVAVVLASPRSERER